MMATRLWEKANLAMSGILICSALFSYYRWQYTPKVSAAAGLQTLTEIIRLDSIRNTEPAPPPVNLGKSIPDLLARIQERATASEVAIRSATPNITDPEKIALDVQGDFRNVMLFVNGIEGLQANLQGFDIVQGDDGLTTAKLQVMHAAAPTIDIAFSDYMNAMIAATPVRNPFEAGDPALSSEIASDLEPNSNYRLTGISLLGGERTATIDGADYRLGDEFHGMKIREIGPFSVTLAEPNGGESKKLFFRRSQGSTKK